MGINIKKPIKKNKENEFNYYHYFYFYMSEDGFDLFIQALKNNHYHIQVIQSKDSKRVFLKKGKRYSFNKDKMDSFVFDEYNGLIGFNISIIDNRDMTLFNKVIKELEFGMEFLFESGGWDATPFYLFGSKEDDKIKEFYTLLKVEKSYYTIKKTDDKNNEFYSKKIVLNEIEGYLAELGMSDKEILEYMIKPNEYLFGKTVIEIVLVDQHYGLINMLKARLGYPDAEPF